MDPNGVAASARQKATLKADGQNVGAWDAMPVEAITPAASPDPRVAWPEGSRKPSLEATQALVASVHERMDALGVPRYMPAPEGQPPGRVTGELTLLGRMDAACDRFAPRCRCGLEINGGTAACLRADCDYNEARP